MHTRHLIAAAYLHVLAFAMLGMGAISLIGYLLLDQPSRHSVVLLPDSALMSVLMGGLILAATRQATAARKLLAALLAALTLYSLLHNLLIGGALMILAVLSHLADNWLQLGIIRLGFKYESTHVANLFALCLGLSIILLSLRPHGEQDRLDPRTLTAGVLGTLLACSSWYLLSTQAINLLSREGDLLLAKTASAATQDLQNHLALMQRMADRWQTVGRLPSTKLWQQEAHSYLRDFPNLEVLALLDHNLQPSRIEEIGRAS